MSQLGAATLRGNKNKEMIPFDEVRCMLCGKKMKSVEFSHLWNVHHVTIRQYERMFPHSPRISIWTLRSLGRYIEARKMLERWKRGELYYGEDIWGK